MLWVRKKKHWSVSSYRIHQLKQSSLTASKPSPKLSLPPHPPHVLPPFPKESIPHKYPNICSSNNWDRLRRKWEEVLGGLKFLFLFSWVYLRDFNFINGGGLLLGSPICSGRLAIGVLGLSSFFNMLSGRYSILILLTKILNFRSIFNNCQNRIISSMTTG